MDAVIAVGVLVIGLYVFYRITRFIFRLFHWILLSFYKYAWPSHYYDLWLLEEERQGNQVNKWLKKYSINDPRLDKLIQKMKRRSLFQHTGLDDLLVNHNKLSHARERMYRRTGKYIT